MNKVYLTGRARDRLSPSELESSLKTTEGYLGAGGRPSVSECRAEGTDRKSCSIDS
jgi:hypothetical protein